VTVGVVLDTGDGGRGPQAVAQTATLKYLGAAERRSDVTRLEAIGIDTRLQARGAVA
jgi:hypothetical protein